jgi:hypothetical protein
MEYRLAKVEDVEQIDALCKRENIATPPDGTAYVAVDDGKIVGFVSFSLVNLVNGFVSDSSLASTVLYEKMISALETLGAKRVVMFPKNEQVESLAIKKGFKFTNRNINSLEKEL